MDQYNSQNNQGEPTSVPTLSTSSALQASPTAASSSAPLSQSNQFVIKTSKGDIKVKLYSQQAPQTVKNFQAKSTSNFYKNLTFHRVEPGFVIQGGDPLGNGTGGGDIPSEINSVPFKRGSIGLARAGDIKVSNDSQFFICLATDTCQNLSNLYVNFGEVVEGMEVVDKIQVGDKILSVNSL